TSKSADGLLLVGQGGREDKLRRLARAGVPFVVWGSPDPAGGYSVVGSDNALGGRLAARRFLETGRRRLAFLGPAGHTEIAARRAGFGAELAKAGHGTKVRDLPVADFSYEAGVAAARAALANGAPFPDAIFCASDTLAIATIAVLRETGVDVPSACSVIGFDDGPSAVLHIPPLTTIRQDTRMAGAVWVETLMRVIDGAAPRPVLLPVELVVRGT
ncbi:MAG TPA: substrate-binding domain-containing protein, partial [Nevskiaceae bacterium]|nr:substrate-binding domain-containing protein [Nevskiaceae bacterium]